MHSLALGRAGHITSLAVSTLISSKVSLARIDTTEHLGEIDFEEETLKHVQAAKFDYLIQPCIAFDKHLKRV